MADTGIRMRIVALEEHFLTRDVRDAWAALGGTSIVMERFDPEEYLRLVETHRVTHTQLVPTHFVRMLKLPDETRQRYDVSSLKSAVHAAAPCPAGPPSC